MEAGVIMIDARTVLLWAGLVSRARSEADRVGIADALVNGNRAGFLRFCEQWEATLLEHVNLTDDERIVMQLRYVRDYDRDEIAGLLGCSIRTVTNRQVSAAEKIAAFFNSIL